MTRVTITFETKQLEDTADEGLDPKGIAREFCQCVGTLLGNPEMSMNSNDHVIWTTWYGVPNEKAQAIESIVQGHTAWSCDLG